MNEVKDNKEQVKPLESMADLVTRLASRFCSYSEISDITGIAIPLLRQRYDREIRKCWANVKVTIRQKQLKKALEDGNSQMLIWLGKQYLGQSDKVQTYLEAEINQTIKIGWADEADAFTASGGEVIDCDQLSAAVSNKAAEDTAEFKNKI